MPEITGSYPTPEQSKRHAKPLERLKRDRIDYEAEEMSGVSSEVIAGLSATAAIIAIFPEHAPFFLAFPIIMTPVFYELGKLSKNMLKLKRSLTKDINVDKDLGYRVGQYIYQGKKPLSVGSMVMKKGDNWMGIELPYMRQNDSSATHDKASELQLWLDLNKVSMKKIKQMYKNRNHKMVTITPPASMFHDAIGNLTNKRTMLSKEILTDKKVVLKRPDEEIIVLTREEFENLTITPQELFQKACDALSDPMVSTLIDLSKKTSNKKERENARQLLNNHLRAVMRREIEMHFNGPELTFNREGSIYVPQKAKVNRSLLIRQTSTGFFYLQTLSEKGEVHQIPLDKLLKTSQQPIEDILASQSLYRKAQIAHVLMQMLQEQSFDELTGEKTLDREQIIARLQDNGLSVVPWSEVDSRHRLLSSKTYFKQLVSLRKNIGPAILPLVLALSIDPLYQAANNLDETKDILLKPAITETFRRTDFPDAIPTHSLDWRISGNMPTNGYYTISTSHQLSTNGEWEINRERVKEIKYPPSVSAEQQMVLERRFILNAFGETTFKIPIKDGTSLEALKILDGEGKDVSYNAYLISDGTIEVTIENKLFDSSSFVEVSAQFVEAKELSVRATEKIDLINESLLSDEARRILNESRAVAQSGDAFENAIAQKIRDNLDYSLNPPEKDRLDQARTPEQMVNTILDLSGATCDVANAGSVLLASADPDPNSYVNIATGYLAFIPDNPDAGRNNDFLLREAFHAYGIDEGGKIRDATPSRISNEKMTQDYVNSLSSAQQTKQDVVDKEWEQTKNAIAAQAQIKEDLANRVKAVGALLTAVSGYFVTRQATNFLRRMVGKKDIGQIADEILLKVYSKNELAKAYDFFSWLSWGGDREMRKVSPEQTKEKADILETMKNNVRYDKLDSYLHAPRYFEKHARISIIDGMKFRLLARYVMR